MMAEFKGTKGKWKIYPNDYTNCRIYINKGDIDIWYGDEFGIKNKEEAQANALLICKAPKMLEMLEHVKDYLGSDQREKVEKLIKEATEI